MPVGEGVPLVPQAFGVHPAQSVPRDLELAGIIADDDRLGQNAMRLDAAPERALRGDPDRVLEGRRIGRAARDDAKPVQMRLPCLPVSTVGLGRRGQPRDHRPGRDLSRMVLGPHETPQRRPKWPPTPGGRAAVMVVPSGVNRRSRRERTIGGRRTRSQTTKSVQPLNREPCGTVALILRSA